MIAYVKMWTAMLHDEWFVSLSCLQRGFFMQLILLAKEYGDTGGIFLRNFPVLSQIMGCDCKTTRKILGKFLNDEKISYQERDNGTLQITIHKYLYWQQLKKGKDYVSTPKKSGKNLGEIPINEHSINRTEHENNKEYPEAGKIDKQKKSERPDPLYDKLLERVVSDVKLYFGQDCKFPQAAKILKEAGGKENENSIGELSVAIRKASEFAKDGPFMAPVLGTLHARGKWLDDDFREAKLVSKSFYGVKPKESGSKVKVDMELL